MWMYNILTPIFFLYKTYIRYELYLYVYSFLMSQTWNQKYTVFNYYVYLYYMPEKQFTIHRVRNSVSWKQILCCGGKKDAVVMASTQPLTIVLYSYALYTSRRYLNTEEFCHRQHYLSLYEVTKTCKRLIMF